MLNRAFVTTTFELPGYRVARTLGIVRGVTVRSRSLVGTIGAGIQSLFGGNITLWTELVFHVADIDAGHRALSARGVAFRIAPRPVTADRLAADFRDPDGHVLSILGPRR